MVRTTEVARMSTGCCFTWKYCHTKTLREQLLLKSKAAPSLGISPRRTIQKSKPRIRPPIPPTRSGKGRAANEDSTSQSQHDVESAASLNGENAAECVSHVDNLSDDVDEETHDTHDNLCEDVDNSSDEDEETDDDDDEETDDDDVDEESEESRETHDNSCDDVDEETDDDDVVDKEAEETDDDDVMDEAEETNDNLCDDVVEDMEETHDDDVDEESEESRETHNNSCDDEDDEVEESHETHDNMCDDVENERVAAVDNVLQRSSQQCTNSSLNLTATADQTHENDTSEADSVVSDGRVCVGEYRVKPQNAEHLRTILSKHGDIGANCSLQSAVARSFFMELVCEAFRELNTTNLANITENKITSLKASLDDAEKEKIQVGWLKTRLDEILEAKRASSLLKPCSSLRQLKAEQETKIQTLREQLTVYGRDLSIKMNEIHALRQKVDVALQDLSQEECEGRKIDLRIFECEAKVRNLAELETLVGDLV